MKKTFIALSAAFGTIPGLAVIAIGLGSPSGYEKLFSGVLEAFGALTLALVYVNRQRIKAIDLRQIDKAIIILGAAAFVGLITYFVVYQGYVFELPGRGPVIYPLWPRGELAEMIRSAGGRAHAIQRYGAGAINEAVNGFPIGFGLSLGLLLTLYQATFSCLTAAFAIAAVRD